MIVDVDSPAFAELIDPSAELVQIGSGYQFAEGPVWNPREQALYFSDIPGDARWRWTQQDGMQLAATPTFKGNGMAYDADGNLLVCEQVSSCLTRFGADGRRELVAWHYQGVYLNSPNDVVVRALDGSIYFTDPDYGRWNDWIGCKREFVRDFKGVYRVPPGGGDVELVVEPDEFEQPNGLCFSPDESILYVNDSPRAEIKAYDVAADGSLSNCRLVRGEIGKGTMSEGNLDGMECDEHGNIWTSGPGGVWVLNPAGERIGAIRTPEICGSVVFGGPDLRTLFLTTTTTMYFIETKVVSRAAPVLSRRVTARRTESRRHRKDQSMVKVIFLFKFRADMDKADVRQWWLTEHGEIALRNLGMRRYVQNHFVGAIDEEHAGAGMGFDGCVEVWWDDIDAYHRTMASPEWKALEDDGPNGLDMTTLMGGFVNEHVMRWDAAPDRRPYTSALAP